MSMKDVETKELTIAGFYEVSKELEKIKLQLLEKASEIKNTKDCDDAGQLYATEFYLISEMLSMMAIYVTAKIMTLKPGIKQEQVIEIADKVNKERGK